MAANLCSVCNTELLDHLICCAGRCNTFFHFTCIGMSRTIFDGYKKVPGLKWQCDVCIKDFSGLCTRLDDLTTMVKEMKSSIDLFGLVKRAIEEVDENRNLPSRQTMLTEVPLSFRSKSKKKKKTKSSNFNQNKSNVTDDVDENVTHNHVPKPLLLDALLPTDDGSTELSNVSPAPSIHDESIDTLDTTVILNVQSSSEVSTDVLDTTVTQNVQPSPQISNDTIINHGIRIADKRTYLCLSGFHHTSTSQQVIRFVSSLLAIDESNVLCRSLKSSRRKYTDFQHISFRIGLKSVHANVALQTGKWPAGIKCTLFNQKN